MQITANICPLPFGHPASSSQGCGPTSDCLEASGGHMVCAYGFAGALPLPGNSQPSPSDFSLIATHCVPINYPD
jgi:hypothetical protein